MIYGKKCTYKWNLNKNNCVKSDVVHFIQVKLSVWHLLTVHYKTKVKAVQITFLLAHVIDSKICCAYNISKSRLYCSEIMRVVWYVYNLKLCSEILLILCQCTSVCSNLVSVKIK